ncbi:1,4-alpha-glucan branching protein GlgB [Paenibacillus sp. CMAA1364]
MSLANRNDMNLWTERYLFHKGRANHTYRFQGAHPTTENGISGVRFTVWAPRAMNVGLACENNDWNGVDHLLSRIPNSGLWSRFFTDINIGSLYKYEITGPDGEIMLKADPYAFQAEVRPNTASIVTSLDGYCWNDAKWREQSGQPFDKPMNIYEVHLGTWRQKEDGALYSYTEIVDLLIPYVVEMGFTHIEFMPLSEHPYDLSWGYQGTGFYAISSRFGTPHEFMLLVDQCHQAGIGVIMDWVPAHFAKDAHGLRMFDGTPCYEYEDPFKAERPGWGTLAFDYAKPEVISFLISNALFWMEMYHIDGLRVDAVTSMIRLDFDKPVADHQRNAFGGVENLEAIAFLKQLNTTIFRNYPNALMMAEESSAWPGVTSAVDCDGLGFNYKWNMGWMNDTLDYVERSFWDRPTKHNLLTFPMCYAYAENFCLPLSHDEVVHGKKSLLNKMPGSYEQKFAGLRCLLGYQMTQPGKKLLFMGGEFGQFIEWKDQEQLDWLLLTYDKHRETQTYTKALNHFYLQEKALWQLDHTMEGHQWISADDVTQSVISYIRKGNNMEDELIIVINFQPMIRENYRIGVLHKGAYECVFNSDDMRFGGECSRIEQSVDTENVIWHQQPQSLEIIIPPLSMVIYKMNDRRSEV